MHRAKPVLQHISKGLTAGILGILIVIIMLLTRQPPAATVPPPTLNSQSEQKEPVLRRGLCWYDWQDFESSYRACLINKFRRLTHNELFTGLNGVVAHCKGEELTKKYLNVQFLQNGDERKMLIPFLPAAPSRNCTHVTLGIGNDIASEQKLQKIFPQCVMYGADPSKESGMVFEQVGRYFQIAVSNQTGNFSNNLNFGGGYYWRTVPTITLVEFLKTRVNRTFIDFLWVDNEGPEYGLAPQFARNGPIEQAGITICQINMEFHQNIGAKDGFTQFGKFFPKLVQDSDYIPILVLYEYGNDRVLFVNARNRMCIAKYFARNCGL